MYKAEDYDEEGWLYGSSFDAELGKKTRSSVVRTRVWLGHKAGEAGAAAGAGNAHQAKDEQAGGWSSLFGSAPAPAKQDENEDEKLNASATPASEEGQDGPDTLFPSAAAKEAEELFPSAKVPGRRQKSPTKKETDKSAGFFGKISAAAMSLPSSVINLAGESSKQAVVGTVQSIKEVSLYGYEIAQAATVAAITADPQNPNQTRALGSTQGEDNETSEVLSMLSKRFPDLGPFERSLVTCCANDAPRYLSPPEPTNLKTCKQCGAEFGMTKFRYQCGYCSESYCRDDLPHSDVIRAFGQSVPSKLCANCHFILKEKIEQQLVQWRGERVHDFLRDLLILYYSTATDTAVDKIMRAAEGTLVAAKSVPIGATAKMAVVSADFLRKYGRAGLIGFILRNEFMQSFTTLKGLIGDLGDLGFQDAAIGMYYFMAMNRGERGANPLAEIEDHVDCAAVSDEFLANALRYAPLALHAIYELDVLDIQRISKLQGFSLIYAHVQNQDVRHPSYALLGSKETKTALVLIRGSKSVQDLLTDIQAHPEGFGGSATDVHEDTPGGFVDAFAHNGMLKAAMWIKDRIVKSLRILHNEGYRIVFAGHSLGAGCAALLSIMLQKEFADLECYAYAIPACVNYSVADSCNDFVHSIVLRDDCVPRAKASNVLKLVGRLRDFKGCWRETANEDLEAVKDRVKTLWAPRKREWAKEQADMKKGKLANRGAIGEQDALKPTSVEGAIIEEQNASENDSGEKIPNEAPSDAWTLTRSNLIEKLDSADTAEDKALAPSPEEKAAEKQVLSELVKNLVEDPKELYIPGRVTHIYFNKGVYEAVHVDRRCEALAHIPVQQNMLSDHLGRNYLSALRIVRDVRRMKPTLPEWVPFGTKTRCMCCDSPFTWNSTSSSEAQQNRDQHNCRRCGWLVCEGCSEKLKSIPEFGINVPVRVCDRCYYEL